MLNFQYRAELKYGKDVKNNAKRYFDLSKKLIRCETGIKIIFSRLLFCLTLDNFS